MKRFQLAIAAGVALAVVGAFWLGRAANLPRVAAQQVDVAPGAEGASGPHGRPNKLPIPYDVVVHMQKESASWNVVASGVQSWDTETVGGLTFLRLTVPSGKLWYIPLEHVTWIEATPIVAPAVPTPK